MIGRLHHRTAVAWVVIVTLVATFGVLRSGVARAVEVANAECCCCEADAGYDAHDVAVPDTAGFRDDVGSAGEGSDERCPPGCDLCACCAGMALSSPLPIVDDTPAPLLGDLCHAPGAQTPSGTVGRIFRPPKPSLA
ncbi:MAG: hypothetical protein ACQEXJ_15385 [Myxococcota bacterium]